MNISGKDVFIGPCSGMNIIGRRKEWTVIDLVDQLWGRIDVASIQGIQTKFFEY